MTDTLGDFLKDIERQHTVYLDPKRPIYARIDGRAFHTFTKGMKRPFDSDLSEALIGTTEDLMREFKADLGYVQSDEISLLWMPKQENSEFLFGGKLQKLTSVLASYTTCAFLKRFETEKFVSFDCRMVNIDEPEKMFIWRLIDAKKNAISMASHHHIGHKKSQNLKSEEKVAAMSDIGVNFAEYPASFRFGTFLRFEKRTTTDVAHIPEEFRPEFIERKVLVRSNDEYFKTDSVIQP